jgi:hypothetical protein
MFYHFTMSTSRGSPGAAQLRLLAEDMRTKLPRELRGMIYSYVWDKDTVDGLQLPRFLSPHRRDRSLTRTPAVAANRHIVGEQLATEAVEWLYSNYHDITIGEPNQLPKLLAGDLFGVGLKAKDCPLRRITTVVSTTGDITVMRLLCPAHDEQASPRLRTARARVLYQYSSPGRTKTVSRYFAAQDRHGQLTRWERSRAPDVRARTRSSVGYHTLGWSTASGVIFGHASQA